MSLSLGSVLKSEGKGGSNNEKVIVFGRRVMEKKEIQGGGENQRSVEYNANNKL